jgi:nitrite reductase/ring-hydroxylating ferredoxin subunit/uncharacterized membrane protein
MSAPGPPRIGDLLSAAVEKIESRSSLDATATFLHDGVGAVLRSPRLRSLLSGSFLGHPLHPLLTDLPLGCWTSAAVLDLTDPVSPASRRLIGVGVVTAVPTALAGISDWLDTAGAEQRVGLVHGVGNLIGISCLAVSWGQRRKGLRGRGLSLLGLAVVSGAGWLGGHLSFAMGVGVDTNAFETGPKDWTPVMSGEAPGDLRRYQADGVGVVVATTADGLYAMADRCSHRGGPLSGGEIEGDCVSCPWHGSRFELRSGKVRRGPATMAQPVYDVRPGPSGVEVRRTEHRALRRHPV